MGALLQHLLFLFLLVVAPAWDYSYTKRLKQEPSSERKIGVYRTLCAWLWISAGGGLADCWMAAAVLYRSCAG